ncbi:unnamed protein product, partial [Gulo gulo]
PARVFRSAAPSQGRAAEAGVGRTRGRRGGRWGSGCYLAHPPLRGSGRLHPLRQPADPEPREVCGTPAVASPGPPQPALKLQQERLELDSGKTVLTTTSGRLCPGWLSTPR